MTGLRVNVRVNDLIFAGKFGYKRWTGAFHLDQPHGVGSMVLVNGKVSTFKFDMGKPLSVSAAGFSGAISDLTDGSTSTFGVPGNYKGGWRDGKPDGFGVIRWDNRIEYKGMWRGGRYRVHGRKLYSRGGGYEGPWDDRKRGGKGISFYGPESLGKHGILRWEGPFVDDLAHGVEQAYVKADFEEDDERWTGDTAVKGLTIDFERGGAVDFP